MCRNRRNNRIRGVVTLILAAAVLITALAGCSGGAGKKVKLDPKNPVTITVWHYYNGPIMNAFDEMVKVFNETVGVKEGIIVEGASMGNVSDLEKAVISSANKEVGSLAMPNIFASYADTAYNAEKMGLLANLNDYFTVEEQAEYIDSYIEEGKIGLNGELRIFPIAKSTEIFMINETDWLPFANECGFSYDDLNTVESVARVAKVYYDWTDAQTPDTPNDGKAFYGRDSIANMFIIASKEFGDEIFSVQNGKATINIKSDIMRKIWDNYYVPYISGHFLSDGRYRSDDAKVGDILCYVGSTSSAGYFPSEVTVNSETHSVNVVVLSAPHFEGRSNVMVQQGAGMVVTKTTLQEEYASVMFLKWFTEKQNNIKFAALSGYMPVKKEAVDYGAFMSTLSDSGITLDPVTDATLKSAFEDIQTSELYTNKAFDGGAEARALLDGFQDKVSADRGAVLQMIENGATLHEAVAKLNTEDGFNNWMQELEASLFEVAK